VDLVDRPLSRELLAVAADRRPVRHPMVQQDQRQAATPAAKAELPLQAVAMVGTVATTRRPIRLLDRLLEVEAEVRQR